MARTARIMAVGLLAAAPGVPAQAQWVSAGPLDRPGISRTADELFRQVCIERFGDPAAMRQVLQECGFRPAPTRGRGAHADR